MGMRLYVTFPTESQAAEIAAAIEAEGARTGVKPHEFVHDGWRFDWDSDRKGWYIYLQEILSYLPDSVMDYLSGEAPQFKVWIVWVEKGAGVVDWTAAVQGEYAGDHRKRWRRRTRFDACRAWVDNHVASSSGAKQSVIVEGPVKYFGEYMTLIRQRKIRPLRRLEPGWFRRMLRL